MEGPKGHVTAWLNRGAPYLLKIEPPGAGSDGMDPGWVRHVRRRSERDRHAPGGVQVLRCSVGADVLPGQRAVTINNNPAPDIDRVIGKRSIEAAEYATSTVLGRRMRIQQHYQLPAQHALSLALRRASRTRQEHVDDVLGA